MGQSASFAATATVTEFGLRVDCSQNGCPQPHPEDGTVLLRATRNPGEKPLTRRVNGHAVTLVSRTVTYAAWVDAPEEDERG